jgi:hypothetical protein
VFTDRPFHFASLAALSVLTLSAPRAHATIEAIVSVKEQKVVVVNDGGVMAKYPVSTSKFGVGDGCRSYKTPLGKLKVCEKIGNELAAGTVIKGRHATGEVLPVNAPGRDPIVTRILWLEGCESQNANARERAIYIHGTPEESRIGKPASFGCIRMRSKDVMALFDLLPVGATVSIKEEGLPRLPKYVTPPPGGIETSPSLLAKKQQSQAPIAAHVPTITPPPAAIAEAPSKTKAIAAVAPPKRPEPIAAMESPTPKPAKAPALKPAIAAAPIRVSPQFTAATTVSVGRADLTRSLSTSILHSGLEDRSTNSEVPRLGW